MNLHITYTPDDRTIYVKEYKAILHVDMINNMDNDGVEKLLSLNTKTKRKITTEVVEAIRFYCLGRGEW